MLGFIKQGWAFLSLLLVPVSYGASIKPDEDVVFFPTAAHILEDGRCEVPVHSWVFEFEENSLRVNASTKLVAELMTKFGLSKEQTESDLFRQRIAWFLVDNQWYKKLKINLNDKTLELNKTVLGGHSYSQLATTCKVGNQSGWVDYQLILPEKDKRKFTGQVLFIPKQGLSVISDIDDTIKISEVLNKKALMRHTFVEPYKAPEGLPAYYKKLADKGAYFHYVSASPWQLYPSLKDFLWSHYPKGTVSLRHFRLQDSSLINFFKSSKKYKLMTIRGILNRYPQHQFILIGDSGENDPEVYRQIAKEFPNNIQQILIRKIEGSILSQERINSLDKVLKGKWHWFDKAVDIPKI
ncbi:MAG: App1 family protein [Thiotrichaceae bacterium]|nr:App1 family protein [Thiotrichaceae bacterium]